MNAPVYLQLSSEEYIEKIWLPVLFLHSRLQKTSVVHRYTFGEEPNVFFIFQATTTTGNINTSFKDLPHTAVL